MRELLFVYGTLRDPDLFRLVTGRPLSTFSPRPFALAGWRVAKLKSAPFPVLARVLEARAPGLVIGPLAPVSIERLKRYEGPEYVLAPLRYLGIGERLAIFLPCVPLEMTGDDWELEAWTAEHKPAALAAIRRNPWLRAGRKP